MKIQDFIDKHYAMTNKELFNFVRDYGETSFFLDLWDWFKNNVVIAIELYGEIVHEYFIIKK